MQIVKEEDEDYIRYGYYKDGEFIYHQEGNFAFEYVSGNRFWFLHGVRHRLDGAACEYVGGKKIYYINDIQYSEEEYPEAVKKYKLSLICK